MNDETRTPYYYRVAETLKKRIESKRYMSNELIPSEKNLEKEFGVSNITIRKALDLLVKDGLLVRKRGVGTQVIPKEGDRLAIKLTGNFRDWYESASGKYPKLEVDVLGIAIERCPEPIRELLSLEENSMIWKMRRIRKFRGEPISYYINYGRPEIFGKLTKKKLFQNHSFVDVFQKYCDVQISKIEQLVEAIAADMDIASILDVQFGTSLFFVKNMYFTELPSPVEVTHVYYRGDRYIYNAIIELDQKTGIETHQERATHKLF
jgi:GntR family transcriptional regulator